MPYQTSLASVTGVYALLKKFAVAHKVISTIIIVAVIGGGWWAYGRATSTTGQVRYVLGSVERGTIVASVSASGQVSASNQLDLKPKVSGEIVYVGVVPGQKVSAGTLIAEIDPSDAERAVRDAEANLKSAQLSLAKLQEPADALSSAEAQHAVDNAYTSGRSDIVSTYLDLQGIMADLNNINGHIGNNQYLPGSIGSAGGETLRQRALQSYDTAYASYTSAFKKYSTTAVGSADEQTVSDLLKTTSDALADIGSAIKSESAFLQWYKTLLQSGNGTPIPTSGTDLSTLTTHADTLAAHDSALTQDQTNISEKSLSLEKLQQGADTIDVQSSQLSVTKAQNTLTDAQANLADYYVRAPFAGTIAAVGAKKYDTASSGTAAATLITSQQIAQLSLNEVDVAKIKAGDKATLTFDAIDGLTLTGKVAEIDTIGAVSQGVVSYTVKIGFDSDDPRVKPGMTVNAEIITDVRADTLAVLSSAVKSGPNGSYVLAFDPPLLSTSTAATSGASQGVLSAVPPQQIPVEVGISNDTQTEMLSGLSDGQQIVVRTIAGTTQSTTQSAPSLFGGGGGTRGGVGGTVRVQTNRGN